MLHEMKLQGEHLVALQLSECVEDAKIVLIEEMESKRIQTAEAAFKLESSALIHHQESPR